MQVTLNKIRRKPQILLSMFGAIVMAIVIIIFISLYSLKSKEILYKHASEQLVAINKIKMHMLSMFLDFRKSDAKALASTETVLKFSQHISAIESQYNLQASPQEKSKEVQRLQSLAKEYKNYFSKFLREYMYTDMMLIDNKLGYVFLSMNYDAYIGKNLHSKEFQKSEILHLWEKVLETKTAHYSDMHLPILYGKEPIMFIAAPVFDKGEVISVLILSLPSTLINKVLHFRGSNIKSCETYAVGKDYLLRSDSFLQEGLTVSASFEHPQESRINTRNIQKAFNNEHGVSLTKDYRGVDVLSSYSLFEFDGIEWAMLTQIDKSAITQQFNKLQSTFHIWALLIALFVFVVGYVVIRTIVNKIVVAPLVALYNKVKGFEDIINNSFNEIYIFSKDDFFFIFANKSAISNSGYSMKEFLSMKPYELKPEYTKEAFEKLVAPLLNGEKQTEIFETSHRRKNGTYYDVHINLQLMDVDGVERFVAIVNDITAHNKIRQEKEHYYYLSNHDHLTKQYNRQMFDKLFYQELQRSRRYKHDLSFILLDIDHFKQVNDTYGHQAGDIVLITLAEHVQSFLRNSDVFARWGGEEFVIFMPHTDLETAMQKAENIRSSIEKLQINPVGSVTCSFGVTQLRDYDDAKKVFAQVDEALYKAKNNGRNRVEAI